MACNCASHNHTEDTAQHHEHEQDHASARWKTYLPAALSLTMLVLGLLAEHVIKIDGFTSWVRFIYYAIAYLPVGWPVAVHGIKLAFAGDIFTEFTLMSLAGIGAFYIGEYPEGVAVMVFYTIGELFQDAAVNRAKKNIKSLLDIRPDKATVIRNNETLTVKPQDIQTGEILQVKPGEKVPLDGELLNSSAAFNTAALTGESLPRTIDAGQPVLAGMIVQDKLIQIRVTRLYEDSSLSRILDMVQRATSRKAKTENYIRTIARIYTPIVVFLALCILVLPYFFEASYHFNNWLYRSLVFLVVSCPCALVISVPLGYFGGIGAASQNGILFKGSNYMDILTRVNTLIFDKTGTLTKGVFKVNKTVDVSLPEREWLPLLLAVEAGSTHPVALAVADYAGRNTPHLQADHLEEIAGHGLKAQVEGKTVLAGNLKLMQQFDIALNANITAEADTLIAVAIDGKLAGYLTFADELKADSEATIKQLHALGIKTMMLSGDKQSVTDTIAKKLGVDKAYGDLLPQHKLQKVEEVKQNPTAIVAFAGDGINDAPVLALSDVGIAMGGLGSDAAIETADMVIQNDQPSRIIRAIRIGKATRRIVWQNITLAFGVKAIVMILGAGGLANLWEAVFADVGVALLAVLNAMRIQRMDFDRY
ncbi:cadmium-translocating P-type ATPase (plasmid) [Pedobacter sp. BS3]|uniref:heavy metal translocating P-type ATPase n=1 Tax=Pedobacter sp. BS3 TaxID=2567937 RepID=UPI0011ED6D99|nr:heavy metal translocating P-type ATPase [Pedobacter sp. BS3]TZF85553.1 cadmium-translocating P-type ATPase [Pedobacter sp. BS3]